MPASQFAIVYSLTTKACRRVVVADTDAEIQKVSGRLAAGEGVLFLNDADHPTDKRIRACMVAIAGALSTGGELVTQMRSVIVQGGVVTDVFMADPSVDTVHHVSGQLIQHDFADIGDLWNGAFFRRVVRFSDGQGNALALDKNSALSRLDGPVFSVSTRHA